MYSASQRLNGVFAFATTVLLCLVVAIALSSHLFSKRWQATLDVNHVDLRYGQFTDLFADSVHKDDEYAFLQFSLDADFNQLWHWNTKELFVYLTVEYQTKRYHQNQVVIWDKRMIHTDDKHVQLVHHENKYAMRDIAAKLRGRAATMTLHWETIPYLGIMTTTHDISVPFTFPKEYTRDR